RIAPMAVLPAGSVFWYAGLLKTWLKPPPANVHPTSVWPGNAWQLAGGSALSVVRVVVLVGSVHRYVPPTPVTSGSLAGHSTVGTGMVDPPLPTGVLRAFAEPPSPDDPRTVTPFCAAEMKAWRRFCSDAELPKASTAEAKLCETTLARW